MSPGFKKAINPPALNLEQFIRTEVPLAWADQRIALGWGHQD
jgi:hypothetical protein